MGNRYNNLTARSENGNSKQEQTASLNIRQIPKCFTTFFLFLVMLLVAGCTLTEAKDKEPADSVTLLQEDLTPTDALESLYTSGNMTLTVYTSDDKTYESYATDDWEHDHFLAIIKDYDWKTVDTTSQGNGEYWITAASVDGSKSLTFRKNDKQILLQYQKGNGVCYWATTFEGDESTQFLKGIRFEYDRLELISKYDIGPFCKDKTLEEAVQEYVYNIFPTIHETLSPGNDYGFRDYAVDRWEVTKVSKDGKAAVVELSIPLFLGILIPMGLWQAAIMTEKMVLPANGVALL